MSMILPKGIVINSPEAERSIEQLDAQPVGEAEIARFWKVYTTTQRRLKDPTAERLENLWWRIWGSRGKELKGAIVAKLFAQISDGETFVPLRGPPNRDEGPSSIVMRRPKPKLSASSTTVLTRQDQNKSGTDNSPSFREQPPMPHPILKKTRGPSNSGPKPTARFISPHDTEDEISLDSSESPNAHVVIVPPSEPPSPQEPQDPQSEKKSLNAAGRKKSAFVASTKKRRPVIVKRQSSQTSQSSNDSPARNSESSQFSAIQSSAEQTPPSFAAQSRSRPQSRFQENFSPSSGQSPKSFQSPKKRVVTRTTGNKHVSPRKPAATGKGKQKASNEAGPSIATSGGDPGPSTSHHWIEGQGSTVIEPESLTVEEADELQEELEMQRILLEEANARVERQNQRAAQMIEQAHVEAAPKGSRRPSGGLSHAHGLLSNESKSRSTVSLAQTLAAPTGELDLGNLGDATSDGLHQSSRSASMGKLDKGKGRDPDDLRRTAMFAKRPIQPIQAIVEPEASSMLSRSKSQLTFLLEKDRARTGDKDKNTKPPKDKKNHK